MTEMFNLEEQGVSPTRKASTPVFYGWWLVAISLLVVGIGFGISVYLYSVVADALQKTYPGSRLLLMMGVTGLLIAVALMSPKVGRLIDRYPIKYTLVGGSLSMGLGFVLIALSTSIWQVIVFYTVFIGVGAATLSGLTVTTLLSRWFVRHRGLAVGIAALGTQVGGFVCPPLVAHFIELYEWRIVLAVLGMIIIVLVPTLTYFTVVDQPHYMGLLPDGDTPKHSHEGWPEAAGDIRAHEANRSSSIEKGDAVPKVPLFHLFRQSTFLLIALAMGGAAAVNTTAIANLSLFATDLGESPERGAYLVSVLSIIGVFSSPLLGRLCDIGKVKVICAGTFICSALAALLFMSATTYPLLIFAALLQGITGGGIFPIWATLVARVYDNKIYGQLMGATTLVVFLIMAPAPLFAGWVFDLTGSYRILFIGMFAFMVACTLMVSRVQVPLSSSERISEVA